MAHFLLLESPAVSAHRIDHPKSPQGKIIPALAYSVSEGSHPSPTFIMESRNVLGSKGI